MPYFPTGLKKYATFWTGSMKTLNFVQYFKFTDKSWISDFSDKIFAREAAAPCPFPSTAPLTVYHFFFQPRNDDKIFAAANFREFYFHVSFQCFARLKRDQIILQVGKVGSNIVTANCTIMLNKMSLYSPISLVLSRKLTIKTRPLVYKYQVVVVRKLWTSVCCMFPRSEHFKYLGTAGETPKKMAVLAKKERKKVKYKRTRQGLRSVLDEKVKADEMQEDIEEIVAAARKRLHLGDSQISSLHLGIDYLLSQKIPFNVVKKLCSIAPKTIAQDLTILKKRITAFKVNSMYEDSMTKIFKKNPKILLLKLEDTLTVKV